MINLSKYPITYVKLATINGRDQRFQFRLKPDVESMKESLKKDGQKLPVILIERSNGERVILCGWTRYLAETELGWEEILSIVIPEGDFASDDEKFRMAYVENARRKPLNNLDMIFACKKLSEAGQSNVQIGQTIDKSEGQVRRYLKVAAAPPEQQEALVEGETSINVISGEGHVVHDEPTAQYDNIVVKTVKNGFNASLKYRIKRDGPEVIKTFMAQINAAYKESKKLSAAGAKSEAQKTAETEKKCKKTKLALIAEGIKCMEAAASQVEKEGFNALGIKLQIDAKKAELKAVKSGHKAEALLEPSFASSSAKAADDKEASSFAKATEDKSEGQVNGQNPIERDKQIRYTSDEGGPTALAGYMVRPLEDAIALMNKQLAEPVMTDEERNKLKTGVQRLQEKIDEINNKGTNEATKIDPLLRQGFVGQANDIALEKKKELNRKMLFGFKESLKTTDDRNRLEQVAKNMGFKTPEEYIDNMEQTMKKQGLI